MGIAYEDIQLAPEQQKFIAELATNLNKPWEEVLRELLAERLPGNGPSLSKPTANSPRTPGNGKGKVWMSPDFDEPLEEFKDYM